MRSLRTATAVLVTLVLGATPALAYKKGHEHERKPAAAMAAAGWQRLLFGDAARVLLRASKCTAAAAEPATKPEPPDLSAYEGLASWVDIFNHKPWANPRGAVRTMAKRGAKAIFLQTSTYGQPRSLYDRAAIDEFLYHAHRRGMKVIAWYVPTFDQQGVDFKRSKRAIRYRSPSGHRFDSFGLDIEAEHVGDIRLRNKRLVALSKRIRRAAGPSYPLGAITPDPVVASYWPDFPYKRISRVYDVFVPMGYWTFRARGYNAVREYTSKGVKNIQRAIGKKDVPIHFIGGIADDAGPSDLRGFTKAAREHELIGASLYDYPITDRRSWFEMRALSKEVAQKRREEALAAKEAEAERKGLARKERREERAEKAKRKSKAKPTRKGTKKSTKAEKGKRTKAAKKASRADKAKGRKNGKKEDAKERRSSSSSASRRDSRSLAEGGRERPHLHAPILSFPRS